MSNDWYLIKGSNFFSGYESDQFNQVSPTVFDELLTVSPEAYSVTVNGISKKVIIQHETEGNKRIILSKIDDINIGDIVVFDTKNWLVVDFPANDKINEHNIIQLCNNTLTITTESTRTIVGHDSLNRPIYDVIPGTTLQYPCIVQSLTNYYSGQSQAINVPEGRILISISNTTNTNIAVGKKFTIFNTDYRINALDRSKTLNDKGILDIIADKITD